MKKRIIGLDFGLKRIGLAISDPMQTYAIPLVTIVRTKSEETDIQNILHAIKDKDNIEMFVIGLPLYLSGEESPIALAVRKFAKKLEEILQKPVAFMDERLTSKQADGLLRELEMKRKNRDKVVDIVSASLILQSFLDLRSCNK